METTEKVMVRNPWEEIYELSKCIIKSDNSKPVFESFKQLLRPINRLLEFNVIRFGFGRQNGKTEWIIQNSDNTTLCIVLSNQHRSGFIQRCIEHNSLNNLNNTKHIVGIPTIYSMVEICNHYNGVFTKIIIDDASLVNNKKIREILEFLFEQGRIDPDSLPELILVG